MAFGFIFDVFEDLLHRVDRSFVAVEDLLLRFFIKAEVMGRDEERNACVVGRVLCVRQSAPTEVLAKLLVPLAHEVAFLAVSIQIWCAYRCRIVLGLRTRAHLPRRNILISVTGLD